MKLSGRCLAGVWWLSGGCIKGVWRVSIGCLKFDWYLGCLDVSEGQVRTKSGQVKSGMVKSGQVKSKFLQLKICFGPKFFLDPKCTCLFLFFQTFLRPKLAKFEINYIWLLSYKENNFGCFWKILKL